MFLKKDNIVLGAILGLLAPLLGLVIFYFMRFSKLSFWEFLQYLVMWKSFFTSVISISLIANAVVFTLYLNAEKDKTAKGVFFATVFYALFTITLKYIV
ncbi:MAG: hypothetical protein ACOVQE_09230 [Chitinophagaceae bacterium]